ncbi:MAG: UDP-3-O-[3-hydroxymyristoyl] glucosamine N-acyltransferase [Halioglobus sp.]
MIALGELAQKLELEFTGDAEAVITGLAPLGTAGEGQLSFLSSRKYLSQLASTGAQAVILSEEFAEQCPVGCLIASDPYLAFARATQLFDNSPKSSPGIHPSAIVSPDAQVHTSASIGPYAVIESGAFIGAEVSIGAGVFIGQDSRIGAGTRIHPHVSVYHNVHVGERCVVHSQAELGSDGFGFAPSPDGWVKICQLGGVRIGDKVEIGGGATIDRGALEHTTIADGAILDNQVHIAHNCSIGKNTAIAACCAVAGSTKIGANCTFGGMVGVAGHIEICDDAHFTGKAMVTRSITQPGSYSSGTAIAESKEWRKNAVRFSQLDAIHRRVSRLENPLKP